jgi:NadR type nicotinamide-nucleotide adenylyltransferase
MVKRIAITGPESTGKSTLSMELAQLYHADWVEEYSRQYLDKIQRPYNQDDILMIAKGQILSENIAISRAKSFLFCDTDLLVTKIWSEVKYSSCDPWILENIPTHAYDLYLLCDIDLPWTPDPLREHPHMRKELFDLYLKDLQFYNFPFAIVSGNGNARIQNAKRIIDEYFIHTALVSK